MQQQNTLCCKNDFWTYYFTSYNIRKIVMLYIIAG